MDLFGVFTVRYSVKDSTSQGKTISEKYSNLAIDGDLNSCAISESNENELPWWSVKLDKDYNVERIVINYNSGSECWLTNIFSLLNPLID